MGWFGQSDLAVRSLSGVIGVITLPLVWLAGRRLGGTTVAWAALVLVATSPFAVRYDTETRMYSLVALLTVLGFLALDRALLASAARQPGGRRRRHRAPALHPLLVDLPDRHRVAVAGLRGVARPRGHGGGGHGPPCWPSWPDA